MRVTLNAPLTIDTKIYGKGDALELNQAQYEHYSKLDIHGNPLLTKEQDPLISKPDAAAKTEK